MHDLHQLENGYRKAIEDMEKIGLEWAEAEALYEQLSELKKTILSECMIGEGSHADRESAARKTARYKQHITGIRLAKEKKNKSWVKRTTAEAKIEWYRSTISNRRSMLQRGME